MAADTVAAAYRAKVLVAAAEGGGVPLVGHNLAHDDVAVQLDGHSGGLQGLNLVPVLVLGVHGHELEQDEVEEGSDHGEAEHDEEQGEDNILRLRLERVVLLQSNQISKTLKQIFVLKRKDS